MPDLVQRLLAAALLALLTPALGLLAVAIRLESGGPALFRAERVGAGGRPFTCYKLRTMAVRPVLGPRISSADDARVTRLGRRLRSLRLDELPQLWNVVRGEMRLFGPRPEDPAFADLGSELGREVFAARPGIAGLAQLAFADEAAWLDGPDPERSYREVVQPRKLAVDRAYLRNRGVGLDVWIAAATIGTLAGRRPDLARISALVGDDSWRLPGDQSVA
jgi:lipopolysaccharide/colanic/teichoic acid biosynthesis glycosyltransferase